MLDNGKPQSCAAGASGAPFIDAVKALGKPRNVLFLNADAGFDCDALRGFLCEKEIIANICINKRRENADDIFVDDELYAERYSIERTNAWMDSFRTLLNRFDTTVANWTSWNYLAFAVLLLKKISRKQKV